MFVKIFVLLDLWKKELVANRNTLLALDRMRLLSDKTIITRKKRAEPSYSLVNEFNQTNGSFRKLEVD